MDPLITTLRLLTLLALVAIKTSRAHRGFSSIAFIPRFKVRLMAVRHASPLSVTTLENADAKLNEECVLPPSTSPTKITEMRHPLFDRNNVSSRKMPVPHPDVWKRCFEDAKLNENCVAGQAQPLWKAVAASLMGKQLKQNEPRRIVKDIEVVFDDPSTGAHELMKQSGIFTEQNENDQSTTYLPEIGMKEQETLQHLTNVLSYYQSIISHNNSNNERCRARIVSTIGSIGTKCPRWHADHVPVRLVMSLLGPGCEYIPFEKDTCCIDGEIIQFVNRHALNNLEEDDTSKANEVIVPSRLLETATKQNDKVVTCATAGEAVLLMGRGWEARDDGVLAAVHRSPMLMEGEKRILLTVDAADWDYSHQDC